MNKRLIGFLMVIMLSVTNVCAESGVIKLTYIQKLFSVVSGAVKDICDGYEESQDSSVSVPKTAEDIVTVAECRRGSYQGNDVYFISYFMNGAVQSEPLIVEEDCEVSGIKSDINDVKCGDMIVIDTRYDETVDFIRVVISLDSFDLTQDFKSQISVPERAAWYLYGEKSNAKNEVYFGYIMKVKTDSGKIRLTMCDQTGKLDNSEIFNITEETAVTVYNAYKNDELKRFEAGSTDDIEASVYPDTDGDIDFYDEDFDQGDMKQAFIYVKRGEIKEIMLVNYSK